MVKQFTGAFMVNQGNSSTPQHQQHGKEATQKRQLLLHCPIPDNAVKTSGTTRDRDSVKKCFGIHGVQQLCSTFLGRSCIVWGPPRRSCWTQSSPECAPWLSDSPMVEMMWWRNEAINTDRSDPTDIYFWFHSCKMLSFYREHSIETLGHNYTLFPFHSHSIRIGF